MLVAMVVVCRCGGRQFARKPTFGGISCSGLSQASDCNAWNSVVMFNSTRYVKVVAG